MKNPKAQRKAIAAAFKAAKRNLWDGRGGIGCKRETICGALRDGHPAWVQARDVVMARLHPHGTVWYWLYAEASAPVHKLTDRRVQAHRHAWLDMLIKEFEA